MGRAKNILFGTKALKSRCLAIRIDFVDDSCLSTVDFCTSHKRVVFCMPILENLLRYV